MNRFLKRNLYLVSLISIPIVFLWHPNWLGLFGNQPYWPLFWLLPWSMINGPLNGLLVGLFIGITLDAFTTSVNLSQIPGLILCGIWFGRLRICKNFWVNHLRYGLVSTLGSFLCSSIYFFQIFINSLIGNNVIFIKPFIENILVQGFLTGLFAPLFCSQLLKLCKSSKEKFI